jgi:hypothetical protein
LNLWPAQGVWPGSLALLVGVLLLVILFVPARLLGVAALQRYRPALLKISYQGKWLGLATAFCFGLHAMLLGAGGLSVASALLLGLCLIVFAILAALSNKWSYAHVKYWKHLNMLVWLAVPFAFAYAVLTRDTLGGLLTIKICVLLLICAAAGIGGLFEPKPGYFARHRVWLMAAGTVTAGAIAAFFINSITSLTL